MSRAFGPVDANSAPAPSRLRAPSKIPRPSLSRNTVIPPLDDDDETMMAPPAAVEALTMSQLGGLGEGPAENGGGEADEGAPSKKRTMTQASLRDSVRDRKNAREGTKRLNSGSNLNASFAAPTQASQRMRRTVTDPSSNLNATSTSVRRTGAAALKRSTSTETARGTGSRLGPGSRLNSSRLNATTASSSSRLAASSSRRAAAAAGGTARAKASAGATAKAVGARPKAGGAGARKKRPAWDIKGRLEDMENETRLLRDTLKRNNATVDSLSTQVQQKEAEVQEVSATKAVIEETTSEIKGELASALQQKLDLQSKMVDMQNEHNTQTQELLLKHQNLEMTHQSTLSSLQLAQAEGQSLKTTVTTQVGQITALQAEVTALKASVEQFQHDNELKDQDIVRLNAEIDGLHDTIGEQKEKILDDETLRKKLHNTIQELKGNIRVFCRVRPFLESERSDMTDGDEDDVVPSFEFPSSNDKAINITSAGTSSISGKDRGRQFNFNFDKVFRPGSGQAEVFDEISQLVQSALDGYNTCVFAYGQTGSGKTFTMEGPGLDTEDQLVVDEELRGMIPRAVEQVFETAEKLREKGWEYQMEADFIEIYNEQLRDLLATRVKAGTKYEIKHDNKGSTSVTNVRVVPVRTPNQVCELLQRAQKNRATATTQMNHSSSRSHSVFRLRITGHNTQTDERVNGILNLIDLAGSERIAQSGTHSGERLKETQNINRSLSALGDVIASLANKDAHTPYRNSKLTYLLQNSLGGNSKTLMFVNASPRIEDLNETLSSLRFATKVNNCEIGTAKKATKVEF
jgi:kinesin family member C1